MSILTASIRKDILISGLILWRKNAYLPAETANKYDNTLHNIVQSPGKERDLDPHY